MNIEQLTKDNKVLQSAINCYDRQKQANINYRLKYPEKLKERSRSEYLKTKEARAEKYINDPDRKEKAHQRYLKAKAKKTEQPEKYKKMRAVITERWKNDPNKKEKSHQQYLKVKAKKEALKKEALENITNTDQ